MAKKDKEVKPVEAEKPSRPDKKERLRKQCPTCHTPLTKDKAIALKKTGSMNLGNRMMALADGEMAAADMQAAAVTLPYQNLPVSDLEFVYGERNNYYDEGTLNFPFWITDRWTNGTNIYDRLSVYFDPTEGEAILTDLNLMLAALPNESPRKATFAMIVDRVTQVMDVWNNPPEEPPSDPLPPPIFP